MLLQCMTLPLRDALLVEDAASGASVHNQPQVNASVQPVICVEYDLHMVNRRLQQWGSRDTNHHYEHAHCINGGLRHDHELFPKQATDQDAVDAVTRQRDTTTRTAADTEVLLPFAQDAEQASTAAPPDDEPNLFDEKMLYVWMRCSWTFSDLTRFRGTASKICVAQRMFNLPRGSNLPYSKLNMPFFVPLLTTAHLLLPLNQPGKL